MALAWSVTLSCHSPGAADIPDSVWPVSALVLPLSSSGIRKTQVWFCTAFSWIRELLLGFSGHRIILVPSPWHCVSSFGVAAPLFPQVFPLAACILNSVQLPVPQIEINSEEGVLLVPARRSGCHQTCHLRVRCLAASGKTKTGLWVGGCDVCNVCNVCCSASQAFKNTTCEWPDESSFRRQSTPSTFVFWWERYLKRCLFQNKVY